MKHLLNFFGYDTGSLKNLESVSLSLGWGWAGLILLLLVLLPLTLFAYRCEGKNVERSLKQKLLIIRILWVVLVALIMTAPMLVISGWVSQRNRLAVMVDTSRSMDIKFKGNSRISQYETLFSKGFIKQLERQTGVYPEVFSFSDTVSPVSRQEIEQFNFMPTGNQTDMANAVKSVVGNLGETSLLGIVMLTDGVSTIGENPAVAFSNIRTPVHFVAPRRSNESFDLSLNLLRPPATVFLNSSVRIRGEIGLHQVATTSIPVTVRCDGRPFLTTIAEVATGSDKAIFGFNIPCEKEGSLMFEVEIPTLLGEVTGENNKTGFLLKVVRERLNIMALSGQLSWDMKFIGNALSTDPNARLVYWSKLSNGRWLCSRNFEVQNGETNPDLHADLKRADVLILSGADILMLKPIEQEIVKRVESGTLGLLLLPSSRTFNTMGYLGTELERLLPVSIKTENWRGNIGNMVVLSNYLPFNFLRMVDDPIQNVEFFATLPKFDGIYEYESLKAGGEVLIHSTVRGKKGTIPFMVRNRAGLGNVIQITGAPLWPMGFRLVSTEHGFTPYSAMIVNMCKWLANRREDAQVSIELPSARGYIGQANTIKTWVLNGKGDFQSNAQVLLTFTDESGNVSMLPGIETSEKGCYETAFIPGTKGLYSIKAGARLQGRELGSAKSELLVETPTAEYNEPGIKEELMKKLANDTNGIFVTVDQIDQLISVIEAEPGQKIETISIDLRNSWMLLVMMLMLPMFEWYLRRTNGLS